MKFKKIVIIGPESTGKSYLSSSLAKQYDGVFCAEYAREYLMKNGTEYNVEDLYNISLGQLKNEEEAFRLAENMKKKFIFFDTDLYVIKVWSEFVFGRCDNRILSSIASREYDLYLLCAPDLPWVKDELREYPDLETRELLFHHYKEIMVQQKVPWFLINGSYEERLEKAFKAVNTIT